jgi:hypothetical protein
MCLGCINFYWNRFEDIIRRVLGYQREVITIHKSKGRQHNGQKKKDKQRSANPAHTTKDRETRTPLKPGVNTCAQEGLEVPAPLVAPVVLI